VKATAPVPLVVDFTPVHASKENGMATTIPVREQHGVVFASEPVQAAQRLLSLDTFRGLTMLVLISHAFGLYDTFKRLADTHQNDAARWFAMQFDHAAWVGCTFYDLIQPAFTFIVGVAMPLSFTKRREKGATTGDLAKHVVFRAALLILLSNVLSNWNSSHPPKLQLINVLCQIALGYVVCFAILQLRFLWQVGTAIGLMAAYTASFFLFPGPAGPFDPAGNVGAVIDRALLGYNYSGYYTTYNFIGNAITILFGAWTGLLFQSKVKTERRVAVLVSAMVGCFALGLILPMWIPIIKRLWTVSFTFLSTGWVLLALLGLHYIVDLKGWQRWTWPAIVVGTNCIFIYAFSQVLRGWLSRGIGNFTGQFWFLGAYGAIPQSLVVTAVMWYLCYFLYQRKIFFKI
jgi:heparan-alpha-glucosaminide N-acetyltransferase